MHISSRGLALIEGFEGFSSAPYWDPYGSVWTRGFGETEGISQHSAWISRGQGEANLRYRIERFYEWALRDLGVPLNQNQWDALCSFVWNLGAGIFTGGLRVALTHQDWRGAAGIMEQYVYAGGQVLPGLVSRRRAEVALFLTPAAKPDPLAVLTKPERDAVNAWDKYSKHPRLHPHGLKVIGDRLRGFRYVIELAVKEEIHQRHKPGWEAWGFRHRRDRWHIIVARIGRP